MIETLLSNYWTFALYLVGALAVVYVLRYLLRVTTKILSCGCLLLFGVGLILFILPLIQRS